MLILLIFFKNVKEKNESQTFEEFHLWFLYKIMITVSYNNDMLDYRVQIWLAYLQEYTRSMLQENICRICIQTFT